MLVCFKGKNEEVVKRVVKYHVVVCLHSWGKFQKGGGWALHIAGNDASRTIDILNNFKKKIYVFRGCKGFSAEWESSSQKPPPYKVKLLTECKWNMANWSIFDPFLPLVNYFRDWLKVSVASPTLHTCRHGLKNCTLQSWAWSL